ncbi:MAG: RluA family pseudouridine synthase [Bacteroidetes bacterium]|nr:RluA family pseudouridine synthase [Bacteroidota bacterium]
MKQPAPTVIYIDDHILIADKPSGITVIPERYNIEKPSVQSLLEKDSGKLWVVHRIDRETTGLVAFARSEEAHKNLSKQFENREVHKLYKAVVSGRMEGDAGEIDSPIAEKPNKPGTMMIHPKGKEALTLFEVEEQFRTCALLNVEIKTGRTHQIRVHFASAGHPLLVDSVYGQHDKFLLSSVKRKYKQTDEEERPVISRLTLHASSLTIHHPATGEQMTFTSPLPHDLEALLKLLRKYDK